jgi:uncharacterized DUF497 family protein
MSFQWDAAKARLNIEKHDVDFADAVGVFEDEWAITIESQEVDAEDRFVTLGRDFVGRILIVVYTYREEEIRLISARRATPNERNHYEGRIRF